MIISAKEQTSAAVAQHYDDLDPFYREIWGDHVHHGLWTTGLENPAQAVENLIACVARRLELDPGQHVCDVGCGYGATAEWLAEHHGVHVTGLTISAVREQMVAHRTPPPSEPANRWFLRPSAMGRMARSTGLLSSSMRPSSRNRVRAGDRK